MENIRKYKITILIFSIVMSLIISACNYDAEKTTELIENPDSQITQENETDKTEDTEDKDIEAENDKEDTNENSEDKDTSSQNTENKETTEQPKPEPTEQPTVEETPTPQQPTEEPKEEPVTEEVTPKEPEVTEPEEEEITAEEEEEVIEEEEIPLPEPSPKPVSSGSSSGKYVVGYYASWASYYDYLPADIDVSKLTHINYAFANINSSNELVLGDANVDEKNFQRLRNVKSENPSLKLMISVGGWDFSKYFSNAALTAESRETFANSCIDFINEYGFDGIDLDWEYPVSGGMGGIINRPEDKQNFTKLIKAIRQKLDEQSSKDGKQYFLTIAGATSTSYIKNIELTKILPYLDYIFIMAYDISGPWDKETGFNAPLYHSGEGSPYSMSVDKAVRNYLNAGANANKLILGMPFYGYKYTLTSDDNNGLCQSFSKSKSISYNKLVRDYLDNPDYERYVHPNSEVPYLFGNDTFITYEDKASITLKVELAKDYGLAGVGIWELSHDTSGKLLSATHNELHS